MENVAAQTAGEQACITESETQTIELTMHITEVQVWLRIQRLDYIVIWRILKEDYQLPACLFIYLASP